MTGSPRADRSPLRGLLPYVFSSKPKFALVVLSGVLFAGLGVTTAGLGAWLAGSAVSGTPWAELAPVCWWFAGASVATAIAAWWQSDVGHDWAFWLMRDLRVHIYDGLERATPRKLLGKRTGELTSTAIADVNTTELFFAHTAGDYLGAVVVSAASVLVIASVDVPVALVTAVLMVLVAVVPCALAARAGEQGRQLREQLGALGAETLDGVQGLRELVVFRAERRYLDRLLERTRALRGARRRHAARSAVELVATDLLLSGGLVVTLLVAVTRLRDGQYTGAWLPVLVLLSAAALAPVAAVSATARELGDVRAAARRILTIIGYPEQVPDRGARRLTAHGPHSVGFENVVFRYTENGQEVLSGVDFDVRPGETVALVGRSGAGKTTCAGLLLRFWDVTGGRITVGGADVRDLPIAALRELVTVVPQEVYLFHASIRENIRLAAPDATDEEVERAARAAAAHEFISALPDGYETVCGERGAQLSGGQRQRIAIARALVKDAPVLVMDEAVSNLDTENERVIRAAVAEASRGRTVVAIAHRLSTISGADRVVFLHHGRVAATGPHDELLVTCREYRELVAAAEDPEPTGAGRAEVGHPR